MPSSIFSSKNLPFGNAHMSPNNNTLSLLSSIKNMMSNGNNPNVVLDSLMKSNPKFAEFVRANNGKSPEQICKDYGIDINDLKSLL